MINMILLDIILEKQQSLLSHIFLYNPGNPLIMQIKVQVSLFSFLRNFIEGYY